MNFFTINKCEVKCDDECINHYIHFNYEDRDRVLILRSLDYSDSSEDQLVFIDDLFVGDVGSIFDGEDCGSQCEEDDIELCKNIIDVLWNNNLSIEGEDKVDYQCDFTLPQKLTFEIMK